MGGDTRGDHRHGRAGAIRLKYGRGVDADGTIREVGIAPRPLQNPIPVYSGFTHSMQTSLYWAREGGKPIVMAIGDADTVSRMIEAAARHVPFLEVFLLFGQGILAPDRCLETLELFAEKVSPRFR